LNDAYGELAPIPASVVALIDLFDNAYLGCNACEERVRSAYHGKVHEWVASDVDRLFPICARCFDAFLERRFDTDFAKLVSAAHRP